MDLLPECHVPSIYRNVIFTCVTELAIATCYVFIVDTVLFNKESLCFVSLVQVSPVVPESRPL